MAKVTHRLLHTHKKNTTWQFSISLLCAYRLLHPHEEHKTAGSYTLLCAHRLLHPHEENKASGNFPLLCAYRLLHPHEENKTFAILSITVFHNSRIAASLLFFSASRSGIFIVKSNIS